MRKPLPKGIISEGRKKGQQKALPLPPNEAISMCCDERFDLFFGHSGLIVSSKKQFRSLGKHSINSKCLCQNNLNPDTQTQVYVSLLL